MGEIERVWIDGERYFIRAGKPKNINVKIRWYAVDRMSGPLRGIMERIMRADYAPYRHMWE